MIPSELCHYTKKDVALENILFEKKIKFGQMQFTNDPKESRMKPLGYMMDSDKRLNSDDFAELDNLQAQIQLQEWKALCLTKHQKPRRFKNNDKIGYHRLFEMGYSRPHMWAQYAENHTGVCLIFDGKRLHENIKKHTKEKGYILRYGSVDYRNTNSPGGWLNTSGDPKSREETVRQYFLMNYKAIFLSKYLDWKNETEFRWLMYGQTKSPEFVSVEGAITSVLVGMDFPIVYEPALREVCKELGISAGRMRWFDGAPHPNMENIYKP
jgi:hypothetical protein